MKIPLPRVILANGNAAFDPPPAVYACFVYSDRRSLRQIPIEKAVTRTMDSSFYVDQRIAVFASGVRQLVAQIPKLFSMKENFNKGWRVDLTQYPSRVEDQ